MRFHWGQGVGHLYSHGEKPSLLQATDLAQASEPSRPGPSTEGGVGTSTSNPRVDQPPSPQPDPGDTAVSPEDTQPLHVGDDPEVVREAEEELHAEDSADSGELPTFILDDDEVFEEEADDTHQSALYG